MVTPQKTVIQFDKLCHLTNQGTLKSTLSGFRLTGKEMGYSFVSEKTFAWWLEC